ncbi:MAG: protein kinase domain-containing protein, partial [Terriglobales bacterium]
MGHYRVVEAIDAGGMGEVYRARDEHLGRDVAIKVLPPGTFRDGSTRKRFRKEALALSKLNHPNIATIFDFDTQGALDFLVMEYVAGITLSGKLRAGPLPESEVADLGRQLADGLAAAHAQGVIHRDLKPRNLRATPDNRLKILDFGLAKLVQAPAAEAETESLTDREPVGTLPYTSPEQLQGQPVDARADIWSAGVVLYEMATGRRAFPEAAGPRLVAQILRENPQTPSSVNHRVSQGLESVILKCLEKDPDNRYQSAKELAVDLRRLTASSVMAGTHPLPTGRKGRRAILIGGIVTALLAVLIGLNAGRWRQRSLSIEEGPRIASLAVLPFVNLSNDPEQEYFTEGMTDQLITDLSRIGALKVISRTSVTHYKGTSKTAPAIARELNVGAVVQGSVLRSGDRVRITVQLTDAKTDKNLWGQSYERDLQNILGLQQEVAAAIAKQIQAELTPAEQAHLASSRVVDPKAYQLYLGGRFQWNLRTPEGFQKARQLFQEAIAQDPRYAEAHAGLADTYA